MGGNKRDVGGAMMKSKEARSDPHITLLCLRYMSIGDKLPSPTEFLLGRQLQDNIPRAIQRSNDSEDVCRRLEDRQVLPRLHCTSTAGIFK